MRRSTELSNSNSKYFERGNLTANRDEVSRRLGELVSRHHQLADVADSDDIEALRTMRRLHDEIHLAQFSLERANCHVA